MKKQKMKAIVCTKYGAPEFLELQEVEKPTYQENEILIRMKASTVTAADTMMRQANPFISRFFLGFTKPKNDIMGTGFAGDVVAVGKNVQAFKEGDRVFGESGITFGANAEYLAIPENGVISIIPEQMTYEEAAPICDGALTSINFLREVTKIQAGQKVLIIGASGSLGTAAVQLAKYYGAEVTGVCGPSNTALVKNLGADSVIDYTKTDYTQGRIQYDIIYDTVGKSSFSKCKRILTSNGVYLCPVLKLSLLFQMLTNSLRGTKKALFSATGLKPANELRVLIKELKEIINAGKLRLILDRRYPLEETANAHRYVDKGHKRGNVVIMI